MEFAETDMAGMVHFSWYFRYMEEAEHAMWRAAGLSIADPESDCRFPRVSATCDYRAPLRFEDEVDVRISVAAISARSIRYECTIVRGDVEVARGTMAVACIGKDGKARGVPSSVREGLAGTTAPTGTTGTTGATGTTGDGWE